MRISIRAGLVAAAVRNRLRSFHHELATGCPIPGVPASSPGWPRRQVETTALLCAAVDGPELSPRGVQLTPPALWALHARRHQVRELTLPCHAHITLSPTHRLPPGTRSWGHSPSLFPRATRPSHGEVHPGQATPEMSSGASIHNAVSLAKRPYTPAPS